MASADFKSFALLGSGRVARHLQYFIRNLGLPLSCWSRNGDPQFNSVDESHPQSRLERTIHDSSHILFAVRDDAVRELAARTLTHTQTLVHFSGALQVEGVHAAHPLMTFSPELQPLEWYRKIPFILNQGDRLGEILPGFANPSWSILPAQRALYHALCSLAGNASYLLWQNIGGEFETSLGLPRELLSPYLHQVVENAARNQPGGFTGPVARGDWQTVCDHLRALHSSPLLKSYNEYLHLAETAGHPVPEDML